MAKYKPRRQTWDRQRLAKLKVERWTCPDCCYQVSVATGFSETVLCHHCYLYEGRKVAMRKVGGK